ncbi:hypothetical protein IQ37_04810 [Chryseobacterium piperi]|uniref:HTH araC/xylS-type domain-containing protein n=2 Tax=Chryseobacterium piperi TaxID=558152 RepID=A0A086BKT4_9FLAO|nr:hypothetical protein IQ37_04810 [Chryseobacterium piperi]
MIRYFIFLLLITSSNLYFPQSRKGFHIPDSLKTKDFKLLEKSFNKTLRVDNKKAEIYANIFLIKGKKNKDLIKIANGYLMLYQLSNDKTASLYLDSMIIASKKIQNPYYLANSYKYKGNYYYLKGEYSIALNNYLTARSYVKNNNEIYYILNFNIGLLKLELKEYQQALQLFLDYKQYLDKNNIKNLNYLSCIYALAYTYSFSNQLNTSDHYVEIGLKKNLEIKDKKSEYNLLLVSGMNAYKRKEYKLSLETLKKVNKLINGHPYNSQNRAISEYYIGRVLYDTNDKKFVDAFEKVDSIIGRTKNVTAELRDAYPLLIDYYKKTGNKEKQLLYIERLLSVDSILNKNNNFLITEINKKHDTPLLLKEKENLISELNSKNYILFQLLGIGTIFLIITLLLYIRNRKKIKSYKRKAYLLAIPPASTDSLNINKNIETITQSKTIDIPQESLKTVLSDQKLQQLSKQLKEFESKKLFLYKNMNLDILSKELNTNRVYLSKVINEFKGQSFPKYLNELRIQYIVGELKQNKNLQKFTIAAIADKAGYNNVEPFTNAFKKITGTLPSYFIKSLQENENSKNT